MSLPKCTGTFNVGCVDILTKPKIIPNNFHPRSLCSSDLGSFVRLYYPSCEASLADTTSTTSSSGSSHKATWLPQPNQKLYAYAFAKYVKLGTWAGWLLQKWFGNTTMDASVNLPLIDQVSWREKCHLPVVKENKDNLPLVIFSHGLAGQRACYSVFCTQLASEGFVVAAVEHRDGSASSTFTLQEDGSVLEIPFFFDTSKTTEEKEDLMKLRGVQVDKRVEEVSGALDLIEKLDTNPADINNCIEGAEILAFKDRIDTTCPLMMGHSFGGVTTLKALRSDPRLKWGIALDPWLEPLPEEFFDEPEGPKKSTLFVFTQYFNWRENMRRCYKLMDREGDFLDVLTLKTSRHYDQCDIPAITPSFIGNMLAGKRRELTPYSDCIRVQRELVTEYVSKFFTKVEEEDVSTPVKLLDESYNVNEFFMIGSNITREDIAKMKR